ncbi:hypothetical protein L3Q82_004825 [Scortum barcoo]|uniref:Uncharacterized protein n=1 Tax=Scortum barcoo TaxID=214431 RepID=A0ACB8VDF0_9TELE|nr:hypothetical protein L3Q82_004825 [Scortum barcoo]
MSHREEALGEDPGHAGEKLCLSAGLGTPRGPPEELEEVSGPHKLQPVFFCLQCLLSVHVMLKSSAQSAQTPQDLQWFDVLIPEVSDDLRGTTEISPFILHPLFLRRDKAQRESEEPVFAWIWLSSA